eukprot:604201-Alexandrium_andersonii.AAC.1
MRVRIPSPCLGQGHRDVRYFHSQLSLRILNFAWLRAGMRERGELPSPSAPPKGCERWGPNPDLVLPTGVG